MRPHRALREEAPLIEETWEAVFERKLKGGDVLGASDVLRGTGKNGWVRKAQHDRAAEIVDAVAPAPIVRRDWAMRLLAHPRRVDRELAVAILLPLARSHPRDLERAVERLRDDTDPAVRRAVIRLERALSPAPEVG
ncbi:MAG: hypothetical protein HYU87_01390 [Chloroflexi bacterium]|nr:hypothetical protein [Chloroflexota bacterium]